MSATSRPKAASNSSKGGNPGASGCVRRPRRPEVPVRVGVQLLPALVGRVERLEERDRVGDVDDDRDVELGGGLPQRIEPRVVHGHETTMDRARRRPSSFQTLRPRRPASTDVAQPALPPTRRTRGRRPSRRSPGRQRPHAVRDQAPASDRLCREHIALAAVQVDHQLDAGRVERGDELRRSTRRPVAAERRAEVVVGVDDGNAGRRTS